MSSSTAAASSSSSKTIVVTSSDGETFEMEENVALQSQTIKHMIEDNCADAGIPLPNVTGDILSKVIEYGKKHAETTPKTSESEDKAAEESLRSFDKDFVKVNRNTLFEFVLAANYLDIRSLLDLTCQAVADEIKNKTVEGVREYFNIENDFTPEEEQKIRAENSWAFE